VLERIGSLNDSHNPLGLYQTYRALIDKMAPRGRLLVVGYPRFFPEPVPGNPQDSHDICGGILVTDKVWIDRRTRDFNQVIRENALAAGAEYVDFYDAFKGHEICNAGGKPWAMNGVIPLDAQWHIPSPLSYHPNILGHQLERICLAHFRSR